MFQYQDYYKNLNNRVTRQYQESFAKLREVQRFTRNYKGKKNKFAKYFNKTSKFVLEVMELEKQLSSQYFDEQNYDILLAQNHGLYDDVLNENYQNSYCNPKFTTKFFGKAIGMPLTYLNHQLRALIPYAYKHMIFEMHPIINSFLKAYEYIFDVNYIEVKQLNQILTYDVTKRMDLKVELWLRERFSNEIRYNVDVIEQSDLMKLSYLFKFGQYVSENEINIAKFLQKQSQEEIDAIAETYTEGFRAGYIRGKKDLASKRVVSIYYHLGQERIIKAAMEKFKGMGLDCIVTHVITTEPNRQYTYDHRFDNALYFNENYSEVRLESMEKMCEKYEEMLKGYAGPAFIESFGEKTFNPKAKKECYKLSETQSKQFQSFKNKSNAIMSKYMPRNGYSFTIIAFPIPEIGKDFEAIFKETCTVNTLDSEKYEKIQQHIINALDQGEYIHVKGIEGNDTDIKVKMHEIENRDKQTNFENCVADVNIPVGEVFTSPLLEGTNGVLHIEEVYLNKLKYENLKITFKDGFVDSYSCTNFGSDEEKNAKYIEENLLFPHKTLPLGEFAIGTNTTAYVMAQKYDILNKLPILIVEKMGPHFAIGDTCFSWEEDEEVINPTDGKEVIAKDNEMSIKRKEDPMAAYTQKHTDITLPYKELASITVLKADGGEIELIKDGRFVLEGTEALNEPLDDFYRTEE